jgi:cation/acetate symporter
VVQNWEETGLIAFEDKNGDGRKIQYYNDQNAGGPFAATGREEHGWQRAGQRAEVDRDIMVLANPEIARLPNWVIALVAAGGIAAALSTAAGLLLVISSSISHDLLKQYVHARHLREERAAGQPHRRRGCIVLIAGYLGSTRQASWRRWWRSPSAWRRPRCSR